MTDQPYDVAASIDATYAIRQPAERECSMPGFMTCECDHITGCQYPGPPNPQPVPPGFHEQLHTTIAVEPVEPVDRKERPVRHTADTITDDQLDELYATIRRLNYRAQAAESKLTTYARAVATWDISERGTYIPHASLVAIGRAAGTDLLGSTRHLRHFARVEQAEAALARVRTLHSPYSYPDPNGPGDITYCTGCDASTGAHPCNTLAALDKPKETRP